MQNTGIQFDKIIELIIKNHNSLLNQLDLIEGDVLRLTNPEFFEQ